MNEIQNQPLIQSKRKRPIHNRRWVFIILVYILCGIDIWGYIYNYIEITQYCENCTEILCCFGFNKNTFFNHTVIVCSLNIIPMSVSLMSFYLWYCGKYLNFGTLWFVIGLNFMIIFNGICNIGFLGMTCGFIGYTLVFGVYKNNKRKLVKKNKTQINNVV